MNKLRIIAHFHYIVLLANDLLWKCFRFVCIAPAFSPQNCAPYYVYVCVCVHESESIVFQLETDFWHASTNTMIATLRSISCIICSDSLSKIASHINSRLNWMQKDRSTDVYCTTPEFGVHHSFKIRCECVWCVRALRCENHPSKIIM